MNLNSFIRDFIKDKGPYVLVSMITEKIGGLLLIIIATNMVSKSEFGLISYANASLDFLFPIIGLGIHQGLLRYGALSKSQSNKKDLFRVALRKGTLYSIILFSAVLLLSPLITSSLPNAHIYLVILSFQLIGLYIYEILRIYVRLINVNKLYSLITITKTVVTVSTVFLLTTLYGGIGYVTGIVACPILISIVYIIRLKLLGAGNKIENFKLNEFVKYGLMTSIGGVMAQLLFAVDILLIGNLLKDETLLAQYKVSSVLPYSALFLGIAFLKTSSVKITNRSDSNAEFALTYYRNFLKLFVWVAAALVVFFYFSADILYGLFGNQYDNTDQLMFVLSIGVAGAIMFRIPLGNILAAVGWARANAINSGVVLMINIILNIILIREYGLFGAAVATSISMWFSGLLSWLSFKKFLSRSSDK